MEEESESRRHGRREGEGEGKKEIFLRVKPIKLFLHDFVTKNVFILLLRSLGSFSTALSRTGGTEFDTMVVLTGTPRYHLFLFPSSINIQHHKRCPRELITNTTHRRSEKEIQLFVLHCRATQIRKSPARQQHKSTRMQYKSA